MKTLNRSQLSSNAISVRILVDALCILLTLLSVHFSYDSGADILVNVEKKGTTKSAQVNTAKLTTKDEIKKATGIMSWK